jgi:hypothetical protein
MLVPARGPNKKEVIEMKEKKYMNESASAWNSGRGQNSTLQGVFE